MEAILFHLVTRKDVLKGVKRKLVGMVKGEV